VEYAASHSIADTVAWLKADGLRVSNRMVSEFLSWSQDQQDLDNCGATLETFEEFCRKRNPDWSPEKVRETACAFFIEQSVGRKDAKTFNVIANLALRDKEGKTKAKFEERKISVTERKIALLEKKAAAYDQARGVLENKELTEDERKARMRELFGLA
jgi:hypothetical protein